MLEDPTCGCEELDMFPEARSRPEDDRDTRYTPRWFVEQLHVRYRFTVDVASAAESPAAQVIGRHWTKADNGLAQPWRAERPFCNPPWSDIEPWLRKSWVEMALGCQRIVCLLPTRTDRPWWQREVEPFRDGRRERVRGVRLTTEFQERLPFGFPGNPEGRGVVDPNFWTVLLIFERLP